MRDETRAWANERQLRDRRLMEAARAESWVLSAAELRDLGFERDGIRHRVATGLLTPQFRAVYLVGRTRGSRDERERAALKACGPGAVLSHRTAAVRHGLLSRWDGPVEVTVPTQRRRQRGLRPVRRVLSPREVMTKDGVPLTTVAATLRDLAAVLDADGLERAVHEAEFRKKLDVAAVERLMEQRPRGRGYAALRRALARRRPVKGRLDSRLEGRFHAFLRAYGFPPSEHNVAFELEGGDEVSVDVLFRAQWLAIEVDGGPHETINGFHNDRRRDRRLEAQWGLQVLRVTDEDLDRPEELDRELWSTLRRRDPSLRRD